MSLRPMSLVATLLAIAALLFAGCGGDDEPAAQSTPTATETTAATESPEAEGEEGETEEERERGEQEAAGTADKPCSEIADLDGEAKRQPPSDMEVLSHARLYKSEGPFGKTEVFYAELDGTPKDLPARRDDAQNELVQNFGFASLSTDQEEGAEAEAHLKGEKHTVDIQVAPLCEGKIRIRYTVQ